MSCKNNLKGAYTILVNGEERLRFSNLITGEGFDSFLNPHSSVDRIVNTLILASTDDVLNYNTTSITNVKIEREFSDYRVSIERDPIPHYKAEFFFELGDVDSTIVNTIGIKSSNDKLFSVSRLKSNTKHDTSLYLNKGETITIVYELIWIFSEEVLSYDCVYTRVGHEVVEEGSPLFNMMDGHRVYPLRIPLETVDLTFDIKFTPLPLEEITRNFNKSLEVTVEDPYRLHTYFSSIEKYLQFHIEVAPTEIKEDGVIVINTNKGVYTITRTLVNGSYEIFTEDSRLITYTDKDNIRKIGYSLKIPRDVLHSIFIEWGDSK